MPGNECVFCKISSGEIPVNKLLETDEVIAFPDSDPSAETHLLIVPRQHVPTFLDLDDDRILAKMRDAAQRLIRERDLAGGYRLTFNGGRFQHVPHLHWHLLAGDISKPIP